MVKTIEKDAEALSRLFGFRSKKEFVQNAVHEKIRRLKSLLFSRTAEKVRRGVARTGSTDQDILRKFERFRHS